MICRYCEKEIDMYKESYYEIWRLAMPAHQIGYMCLACDGKRWSVRLRKFIKKLFRVQELRQ